MTLIEGIGDEVVHCFGFLLFGLFGFLAWSSTNIRELPRITVLVFGSREQSVQPQREEPEPVEIPPETILPDNKLETNNTVETTNDEVAEEPRQEQEETENIRIRLKYLNDDQKLVEGNLKELLGDFKRRNFHAELSRQQRIRLIFNGHVLQSDDRTLQGCGLFDNCVVHCLVHSHVVPNPNANAGHTLHHNAPPEWNLGGLLYVLLTLMFSIAWFCRYHYSHFFNLLTTGTLFGLTIMFAGSIIGLYMPDNEVAAR